MADLLTIGQGVVSYRAVKPRVGSAAPRPSGRARHPIGGSIPRIGRHATAGEIGSTFQVGKSSGFSPCPVVDSAVSTQHQDLDVLGRAGRAAASISRAGRSGSRSVGAALADRGCDSRYRCTSAPPTPMRSATCMGSRRGHRHEAARGRLETALGSPDDLTGRSARRDGHPASWSAKASRHPSRRRCRGRPARPASRRR